MDKFFRELGKTVSTRWKNVNFSPAHFPAIAQSVLEKSRPALNVDLASALRDFLLDDEQPFQTQSGFGEPELVVYDDPRFYIQLLFWLNGTTDIHQHTFSGAFHVLEGSSLQSHFEFTDRQPISAHLSVGNLQLKEARLLPTGATVPIVSGSGCIHSLFHLDTPSLTLVVRTHNDPGSGPQFTYLPPHLALDPFHHDALTARRKQLLDVLEKTADESYPELVLEMMEQLDFERGFFILQNGFGYLRSLGRWAETLEAFQRKHGAQAAYLAPTLEEIVRRDGLVSLRDSFTDPEHRFFLALLLNVSAPEPIISLISERVPGDPIETILRWAEELSVTTDDSTWLLDAEFPEALSVPCEQQPECFVAALEHFLKGRSGGVARGSISLSPSDLEQLRGLFEKSSFRALLLKTA